MAIKIDGAIKMRVYLKWFYITNYKNNGGRNTNVSECSSVGSFVVGVILRQVVE